MVNAVARLGLRARVTLAFALGALLLSLLMGGLTYGVTRRYLVRQRESAVIHQAFVNAQLVRAGLRSARPDVPQLLGGLETGAAGSESVLRYTDRWFATSIAVGRDALPVRLRSAVLAGTPARQRYPLDGSPHLVVGVPIPSVDAQYFEVFPLAELDRTVRLLGVTLVAAAALTALAGAFLGRWASGRVLTPVSAAARAAADIAGGHLDTRLDEGADADLAVLASSFNRMADALKERIERDARFASDVSHELRSPLTTIATSLQVLVARRDELPERSRMALDLLAADVDRFERLVQDLLEISRFDAGVARLAVEDVRVSELLAHAVPASSRASVDIEPDAAAVSIRADKRRLERIVTNLLTNADAHGGGAVRIGLRRVDRALRLEVDDKGPGVPAGDRPRIFERFARGAAAGRRSGTGGDGVGLGLALVDEHVRLHRGRVWVEDAPGGGARFVVELPIEVGG
ncbi:MAG: two-component system, OmpR family, sensor histidine kinase MtrB [Actinomycetota bacterium]|nr:two-component system, OmpR family, sensor histidine kinase MtrB [Actinomycetota bacterium]